MTFGNKLAELLFSHELTQKQVAADLNIAQSTISGYIRDFREPDIAMLKKIAKYFNVTIDYLLSYNETPVEIEDDFLSESEQELINTFRCLNNEDKELLIEQSKLLIKRGNKKNIKSSHVTSRVSNGG